MNAVVSPITVPPIAAKAQPFGTDAVYKGYDLMVRKCATHVIPPAQISPRTRADLVRAIGTPAVSFAASAADGSILLCCPDGLPDSLTGLAEAVEPQIPPVGSRLDVLEHKLDLLIHDHRNGEHLADRMAALEFTLRERLDPAAEARSLDILGARVEAILLAVAQIPDPVPQDLTPVLAAIQHIAAQISGFPRSEAPLLRLDGKLDDLVMRLNGQLSDLGRAVAAQADQTGAAIATLHLLDVKLHDLSARLDSQLPDLGQAVTAQAARTGAAIAAQSQQIESLTAQIDVLANRPHPVLDMPAALTDRLDTITHTLSTPADLTQLATTLLAAIGDPAQTSQLTAATADFAANLATVLARIGQPAQTAEVAAATDSLAAHLATLATQIGQPAQAAEMAAATSDLAAQLATGLVQVGQPAQTTEVAAATSSLAAQLAAYGAQIGQPAQASEMAAATHSVAALLAALAAQLGQPAQAVEVATASADLAAQLAVGLTQIGQPAQAADLAAGLLQIGQPAQATYLEQTTGDLSTQLAAGLTQLGQPAQSADLVQIAGDLAAQLAAVLAQIGQPAQTAQLVTATEDLAHLATGLAQLGQQAQAAQVTKATADLTAQFTAGLSQIGQPAQAVQLAATASDIAAQLTAGLAQLGQPAQAAQLTATASDIAAQLTAGLAQLGQPAQAAQLTATASGIAAQLATGLTQLGQPVQEAALLTALTALAEQIDAVAQRPDPVIDLTLHHQSFARFGTAIGNAVQRLETVAETVTAGPDLTAILTRIDALPTPDSAIADLSSRIDALARDAARTPDMIARLQAFETALVAALPDDHGLSIADGFAALSVQLAEARAEPQIAALAGNVAQLQSNLSDQLAILLARPDNTGDIAEQKHHLAEFAAGLADLVQWLEPVTRDLTTGPDHGPILTALDELRRELILPARDAVLEQGLAQISDQIADLVKSPDSLVSLAEQRQGFASFSNALSFLMERVDCLVAGGAFVADQPDAAQLQGLTTTLSDLVLRLEDALAGVAKAPATPDATEPDPVPLIQTLADATTALAHLVQLIEGDMPGQPPAASATVAQLFDRLDDLLPRCDLTSPAELAAIATLSQALHGFDQPQPGVLHTLRLDFAELVARALQGQAGA
ncbi:MAG: hypothetical protein H7317_15410 [Pseudorhodobacter sp.]|nr:hypothetical protein [Pseudorhodobacter sp.]